MKNRRSSSIPALALMLILLLLGACTDAGKREKTAQENVEDPNPPVPEMDIHTATILGDIEVIKQHIQAGSDLNVREPVLESTPLISAAVFGKSEVARALVEAGAEVNLQNKQGASALHSAAFLCRLDIVELLLEHGAKKDLKDIYGSIPLQSVAGPFEKVRPIYDQFSKDLGPLGFKLDYEYLEETRPVIAKLLR